LWGNGSLKFNAIFCKFHVSLKVINDVLDTIKVIPEPKTVLVFSFTTILFQIPFYDICVYMAVNAVEKGGLQIVL
jgi:hypothetical protein